MSKLRFETYKDEKKEWRWRLVHQNGHIMADSAEGYNERMDMMDSIHTIQIDVPFARIVEGNQRIVS